MIVQGWFNDVQEGLVLDQSFLDLLLTEAELPLVAGLDGGWAVRYGSGDGLLRGQAELVQLLDSVFVSVDDAFEFEFEGLVEIH